MKGPRKAPEPQWPMHTPFAVLWSIWPPSYVWWPESPVVSPCFPPLPTHAALSGWLLECGQHPSWEGRGGGRSFVPTAPGFPRACAATVRLGGRDPFSVDVGPGVSGVAVAMPVSVFLPAPGAVKMALGMEIRFQTL